MPPTFRSNDMTTLTVGTMVNANQPTDEYTPEGSNHSNSALPMIQTESRQSSLLQARRITQAPFDAIPPHENTDEYPMFGLHLLAKAALEHAQGSDKIQGASGINKAKTFKTDAPSKAHAIKGENILQRCNNTASHSKNPKIHVCEFVIDAVTNQTCDKRFSRKCHLTIHKRLHTGEKPFVCGTCNKTFTQNSHLTKHQNRLLRDQSFPCKPKIKNPAMHACNFIINPNTNQTCAQESSLETQLEKHAGVHIKRTFYPCNVCNRQCRSPSILEIHLRAHTGEKPFRCSFCRKTFSQKSNYTRHKSTHHTKNIRPYICPNCKKSFKRKDILVRHMFIHIMKKPFSCDICKKRFRQQSNCTRHNISHTKAQSIPAIAAPAIPIKELSPAKNYNLFVSDTPCTIPYH